MAPIHPVSDSSGLGRVQPSPVQSRTVSFKGFNMTIRKQKIMRGLVAVVALAAAGASQAAGVDVTSVVTAIGDQAAPVAAIGGAVLVLVVGVKAFKWVRSALS